MYIRSVPIINSDTKKEVLSRKMELQFVLPLQRKKVKTLFLYPFEVGRPSHKDKVRAADSSHPGDPSTKI